MKLYHLSLASVLAALAAAQTTPEFPIQGIEESLTVTFTDSNTTVSPPGILLPRRDVLTAPTVYRPMNATGNVTYVLFMIDQDVLRNNTKVSLLHWLQPNLVATPEALSVIATVDGASTAVGAAYIPPTPPSNTGAHRYTLLLYEQPSMWTIPSQFVTINPPADSSARIGFNITELVAASGLSTPVAANYFRVLNGTAIESSSAASDTYSTSTTAMSSGAATASMSMTASGSAASATSGAGSATSAMASATASATDGGVAIGGVAKELLVGLAMSVVGAGFWMM